MANLRARNLTAMIVKSMKNLQKNFLYHFNFHKAIAVFINLEQSGMDPQQASVHMSKLIASRYFLLAKRSFTTIFLTVATIGIIMDSFPIVECEKGYKIKGKGKGELE
jgi:hypothetical protein